MKVAYFTAGTVGAGHLVRGLAVGRGLSRAGFRGEYRIFGPELPFPAAQGLADFETVVVETDTSLRDRQLAQTSRLAGQLRRYSPDLLLVDMFWAPLRWFLSGLPCEAWLLVRICPPHWLTGPPGMPFEPAQYARILAIEPMPGRGERATIDPIVISNPDECRPPAALRERLGILAGGPLTVVLQAGRRGESEQLRRLAGEGAVAFDLFEAGTPFPAAEWLGGADRLVAGAGYNAFWESRWLGYHERTEWLSFPRSIDDQALRLELGRAARPRENGADVLARWILEGGAP
ncbi:MAG TPA: hypothetical protein VF173_36475 [Thermoanaerobaculia bacterium]|nr:hypothetical protein [Thermoanaerobaculia bacterium]